MKALSLQHTAHQDCATAIATEWMRCVIQDSTFGFSIQLFMPKQLCSSNSLQQRLLEMYYSRGSCCRVCSSPSTQVNYDYIPELHSVCFLKRFFLRNSSDYLKHLLRPSRAQKTFNGGMLLQRHGFSIPASLGILESRNHGCIVSSALLMAAVAHSTSLIDLLRQSDLSRRTRHLLAEALGREIGRMHALGIVHGDMNAGKIFVSYQDGIPTFTWIDNERVRRYRLLPKKLRLKNVRQLNCIGLQISHSDRLRFWISYCRHYKLSPNAAKRERRIVAEQTKLYWSRFGAFTGRTESCNQR